MFISQRRQLTLCGASLALCGTWNGKIQEALGPLEKSPHHQGIGKVHHLPHPRTKTSRFVQLHLGYDIIDLEQGYALVCFYEMEDYLHVLDEGPWIVMGHCLTVARWRPNFLPSSDVIKSMMARVIFSKIPIELFNEDVLMQLENKIGRIVKVDKTTMTVTWGRSARVCVQIDL